MIPMVSKTSVSTHGGLTRTCVRACAREGLAFRVDCTPPTATAQQKGAFVCGGRVRFYTKKKVRQGENFLAALIAPHRPDVPFSGPVSLFVHWTFPYRKSERKSVTKAGVGVPHTSRPDLDNIEKNLLDVLTRLSFWTDDSLVAEKHTYKCWGPNPGIHVGIEPLEDCCATAAQPARACARANQPPTNGGNRPQNAKR